MIDIALRVPFAAIERRGLDAPTRSDAALSQVVNALGSSNVSLASAGAVASASSTYSAAYPVAAVNDNERAGVNWGNGGRWAGSTTPPDWVEINFNGTKTIDRVVVYTLQDRRVLCEALDAL